jgi:hypothetical protein
VLRPRSVLALHGGIAAAVLVAACSAGHVKVGPLPTFETPSTTTTSLADFSSVSLGTVAGHPNVKVTLGPGQATLNGTVTGPDGAVPGATVHIERIVDGALASTDVGTQPDGTWTLPNLLGGEFRVRAWLAPDLSLTAPALIFMAATDTKRVDLVLSRYSGTQVGASVAPNPPIIDEPASIVVEVTTSVVGPDGVVRATPSPAASVQIFGTGQWQVDGSSTETTNAAGLAEWRATCTALGPQPLSVVVNAGDVVQLNLPACSPVPPTTTTTVATSTTVPGQTTTTRRLRRTTTTSSP